MWCFRVKSLYLLFILRNPDPHVCKELISLSLLYNDVRFL